MDNLKSYEFIFLYLINKCILLFKYIENQDQKEILYDIKIFINKLKDIFSLPNFENNINKKNKILQILIEYFEKIIETKIYILIKCPNKDNIISEIEKLALKICEEKEQYNQKKKEVHDQKEVYDQIEVNDQKKVHDQIEVHDQKKVHDHKEDHDLENRINDKIKNIFNEIENNIKKSLKEYFIYTENVEYDLDKKFNEKMQKNNIYIENKIKEFLKNNDNNKIYSNINNLINEQIKDIYIYVENIINTSNIDIKKKINYDIENKIKLLGNIFNENIKEVFHNLNTRIIENEHDLINIINEKLRNNFSIVFDKENNEMQLYYYNDLITSTKINIKGLIGPKGPQGNKGDTGYTPIIRRIQFTENNKIKFIVQENNTIYEVLSDNNLPPGPQGIQGERGLEGKTYIDLKWNQENVMRIDNDIKDSLIFLKSLCIGDKSHCLKDNSLAIGGAKCFQNNSFAIGSNSKTLDSESIAFFGTCIGKKSYSYRADNVDENVVQFGKKEKNTYNINTFDIFSKEINLDCDILNIKTNKYENNKIKELEEKIISIEKKLIEISKKK